MEIPWDKGEYCEAPQKGKSEEGDKALYGGYEYFLETHYTLYLENTYLWRYLGSFFYW